MKKIQELVDKLVQENKISEFEKAWVKHFVERMKPQCMPQAILDELNSIRKG